MPITALKEFLQKESTGGLPIIAAALAMLAENSPRPGGLLIAGCDFHATPRQ
jgi:Na+/H+ antiporter NhaA